MRRSLLDIIRWGCGRRFRFLVHGKSMTPTLFEGASVFCSDTRPPVKNSIIVLYHPQRTNHVMIKRCIDISKQGLWVEGDNQAESTDSRYFGWVHTNLYIGRVTSRL